MLNSSHRYLFGTFAGNTLRRAFCAQTASTILTPSTGEELNFELLSGSLDGVGVLSLYRPQTKNALSRSLLSGIRSVLDHVQNDSKVRVLVLRSLVPGAFCSGADLKERAVMPADQVTPFVASVRQLFGNQLRRLAQPTLAALDGVAMGGGLEMALACDVRVAASGVKMGLVETRLAIIPGAGGTQLLSRLIGASSAKQLILTGAVVDADEAGRMGLVNTVVEQNSDGNAAYRHTLELAEQIAANGPLAVRQAKLAINAAVECSLESGLAVEEACYAQLVNTSDRLEGLRAFREKRPPKYRGE